MAKAVGIMFTVAVLARKGAAVDPFVRPHMLQPHKHATTDGVAAELGCLHFEDSGQCGATPSWSVNFLCRASTHDPDKLCTAATAGKYFVRNAAASVSVDVQANGFQLPNAALVRQVDMVRTPIIISTCHTLCIHAPHSMLRSACSTQHAPLVMLRLIAQSAQHAVVISWPTVIE